VLTAEGHTDLAYKLLHQDAMPSWLYSVKNGATTVWERWNSYSKEDGFGPVGMNSFNHYSYGAIAEWMYSDMAGIARDPAHPGFKRFVLQPHLDPTGKITRVAGSFRSPYGRIVSRWALDGKTLRYTAKVPANTSATLRLPKAKGVATYRLASGTHSFTTTVGR
jgi:alpha-L-rhamnosidase